MTWLAELTLVVLLWMLLFALLRPRSAATWFGFTVGFCCLVGLYTTRAILASGVPLDHGLLGISILMLGSMPILRQRPGPMVDTAVVALSLIAVFYNDGCLIIVGLWLSAGVCR